MLPLAPEINCESDPRKNALVFTNNSLGSVRYLKKLSASATNSNPTPLYVLAESGNTEPDQYINPGGPVNNVVASSNPIYPTDRIYAEFTPAISIPLPTVFPMNTEPVNKLFVPAM